MATKTKAKKAKKKNITTGVAHIHSTHNNTIITFTDEQGNAFAWSSSGAIGYKGSKKSTPYAAKLVAQTISKSMVDYGVKEIKVRLKGTGPGKDASLRQLQTSSDFKVVEIKDMTPKPFNGCRKPKKRWNT